MNEEERNGIFKNITLESQDKVKRFSNKLKEEKDISLLGNKGKGSHGHLLEVKKSNNKKNSVVKLINEDAEGAEDDMKNEIQFYQSTVNMIYDKIDNILCNKLCNEDRDDLDKNIVKYIKEAEDLTQNTSLNKEEKERKIKKYVFKKVLETDIPIARPKGLVEKNSYNRHIVK